MSNDPRGLDEVVKPRPPASPTTFTPHYHILHRASRNASQYLTTDNMVAQARSSENLRP